MIRWSKEHLEVLNSAFPEIVDTVCVNTLLQNAGKRQVVSYVKYLLKQQETKLDKVNPR